MYCTNPLCKFCPNQMRQKLGSVLIRLFICFYRDMSVINMMMMMMMMNAQTIGTGK